MWRNCGRCLIYEAAGFWGAQKDLDALSHELRSGGRELLRRCPNGWAAVSDRGRRARWLTTCRRARKIIETVQMAGVEAGVL